MRFLFTGYLHFNYLNAHDLVKWVNLISDASHTYLYLSKWLNKYAFKMLSISNCVNKHI